jgi:hypothetical protein
MTGHNTGVTSSAPKVTSVRGFFLLARTSCNLDSTPESRFLDLEQDRWWLVKANVCENERRHIHVRDDVSIAKR